MKLLGMRKRTIVLLSFLAPLLAQASFSYSKLAADNEGFLECVDQDWCTIPAFSTYCEDPDFRQLMRTNCPAFCGICTNAKTDDGEYN